LTQDRHSQQLPFHSIGVYIARIAGCDFETFSVEGSGRRDGQTMARGKEACAGQAFQPPSSYAARYSAQEGWPTRNIVAFE
jgi:hypothetical protein